MNRQLVGLLGIVLGIFGLAWHLRWLVWVAVGALIVSLLLRILAAARARWGREGEGRAES